MLEETNDVASSTDKLGSRYEPVNSAQNQRKQYVPTTLHPLTLLGFAILCLGCISALEAAFRTAPLSNEGLRKGGIGKRQDMFSPINIAADSSCVGTTTTRLSQGLMDVINCTVTTDHFKFKRPEQVFASDLSMQRHHKHDSPTTVREALDNGLAQPSIFPQSWEIGRSTKVDGPSSTESESGIKAYTTEVFGLGLLGSLVTSDTGLGVPNTTTGSQTEDPGPEYSQTDSATLSNSDGSGYDPQLTGDSSQTILNGVDFHVYYFAFQYLPNVIAVLLSMLWRVIDTDIKRIETFYQLSENQPRVSFLTENLLFTNAYFVSLRAAWRQQWIVFLSAIIYFPFLASVQFLAPITIFLDTVVPCDGFQDNRTCGSPFPAIRPVLVRVLQGVLGVIAACVIAIAVLQRRRKSLLCAEPWSLAGLATLVADWSGLRRGFGAVDVGDSMGDLKRLLAGSGDRYALVNGEYQGKPHVGIQVIPGSVEGDAPLGSPRSRRARKSWHVQRPLALWTASIVGYILFLGGVLTILLIYQFTSGSRIEHFMSGQGIGVKVFFVVLAVTARFGWEPIEREARHLEVFHILSLRHQHVSTLFRDHPRSFPLVSEISALFRGRFFLCLLGTVGLLIEVLVIVISGVPYSGTQTYLDANIAMFLSVSALGATIIAAGLALYRRRRMAAGMPRVPYTLAAVMTYLYAARMLDDFVGLSTLGRKDRDKAIMDVGRNKTYGFGWTVGRDDVKRVGVDEEELEGDYRIWQRAG
ncbi:hypothetical protein K440DRAFT_636321 [Wilcoxina mikolae CBS 423.85]|nr:hypothetical protein K440DRAFT_636321 [Wilcoxina mikolae CBS 423.85]